MKKICALCLESKFSQADRNAKAIFSTLLPRMREANNAAQKQFIAMAKKASYETPHFSEQLGLIYQDLQEPHIGIFGENLIPLAKAFGLIHGLYLYRRDPHTQTLISVISESFGGIDRLDKADFTGNHYTHYQWAQAYENKHHRLQSITKSISALIFAAAMNFAGKSLAEYHEPLSSFIPEYEIEKLPFTPEQKEKAKENLSKITLKNLLNMSSGLQHDVSNRNIYEEPLFPPWCLDLVNECPYPGKYSYSDFDANLLGKVIELITGKQLFDFAIDHLFLPLGITDPAAKFWKTHSTLQPPFFACSGGLSLTPNQLAKLGQLVLQNGQWFEQGEKTLDLSEWVQTFKTPSLIFDDEKIKPDSKLRPDASTVLFKGYGHYWWAYEDSKLMRQDKSLEVILFSGIGGQRTFIVPDLDIVMIATGGFYKVNYATHEKEAVALSAQSRELFAAVIQPYIDF